MIQQPANAALHRCTQGFPSYCVQAQLRHNNWENRECSGEELLLAEHQSRLASEHTVIQATSCADMHPSTVSETIDAAAEL